MVLLKSALSQQYLWNESRTQDDWLICWEINCGHSVAEVNVFFSWNCLALNMSMLGKSCATLLLSKQLHSVIGVHFSNISRSLDHNIALAANVIIQDESFSFSQLLSVQAGLTWPWSRDTFLGACGLKFALQWTQSSMKESWGHWDCWQNFLWLCRRKLYSLGWTFEKERDLFPLSKCGPVTAGCPKMELNYYSPLPWICETITSFEGQCCLFKGRVAFTVYYTLGIWLPII